MSRLGMLRSTIGLMAAFSAFTGSAIAQQATGGGSGGASAPGATTTTSPDSTGAAGSGTVTGTTTPAASYLTPVSTHDAMYSPLATIPVVGSAPTSTSSADPLVASGGAAGPSASGPTAGAAGTTNTAYTQPTVPGNFARLMADGRAAAPANAPLAVQQAIWAANALIGKPYIYGGGHGSFTASGYDCSGTVSFALHGGGLLRTPLDSSSFMRWGSTGRGAWISVFTNPGHAYVVIAGLRLDTSAADDLTHQQGPRWRVVRSTNSSYTPRHPLGL